MSNRTFLIVLVGAYLIAIAMTVQSTAKLIEVKAQRLREEAQREVILKMVQHGVVTDYLIRNDENYNGEVGRGFCLDQDGTKVILENI